MEYDIPRKLSPEETICIGCQILLWKKSKKTFNRQFARNFKSSREWIINILSAELAESVLEVSLLLAQMGSSSELSLFTYGVSKPAGIRPLRKRAYSNILKILPPKNENVQVKVLIFFHISAQNIDYGYSLEPPRRGGSNEYPQSMF